MEGSREATRDAVHEVGAVVVSEPLARRPGQLEKQRESGVLRAVGLTAPDLRTLILMETTLMGAVGGSLSMRAGLVLTAILVWGINQRSFGWTLQMVVETAPFLQAIGFSLLTALPARTCPAIRMGRLAPANALQYEQPKVPCGGEGPNCNGKLDARGVMCDDGYWAHGQYHCHTGSRRRLRLPGCTKTDCEGDHQWARSYHR
ncbi:MAG: ABC transporter permease [Anaerolineae bacterium]|jgi:hypothetical protein